MIDTKKFVVAFLALAILAGSTALGLSSISKGSSRTAATVAQNSNSGPLIQSNAFVPQSAAPISDDLASATAATSSVTIDPNNLSENFGNSVLNNLIATNPNGPRDNGNGTQTITATDAQAILSDMSGNAALANLQTPDWDFEAAKITTRIATSSSQDDAARYVGALSGIIETRFVKTNLQAMANPNSSDPQNLPAILSNIQGALSDIGGLTAPKDLADFHKGLIKLLVYEKNAIDLVQNASDDPLRALLVLQSENGKYQAAVQEFRDSAQKAVQNKTLSFGSVREPSHVNQNGALALFDEIFGIPEAHAQWAVFDPITEIETTAQLLQTIWEHLQSIVLQMLKNFLTLFLEKLMLLFVKNPGGLPRFLQGWRAWASNAFNTAAGSAIYQISLGLCPSFNVEVLGWLKDTYPAAIGARGGSLNGALSTNCTLSASVGNVSAFYNDFNAAGFEGFGALLAPSNNPFGTFAQAFDSINGVSDAQLTGVQNKAVGGSGYKGTEFCDDGSIPNPLCGDGSEPFVTTPGTTVGDSTNRNVNSSIDLIVNANDWVGLLIAITNALFQHWINAGEAGLLGTAPPNPPAPAAGGGTTCQATSAVAASSTPVGFTVAGAPASVTWSVPGGNPPSGSGSAFTTSFTLPGTYTANVTLTDVNGNTSSTNCSVTVN